MTQPKTVSVTELHALMAAEDVALIDVREANEFEAFRVPGARLFALSEFDAEAVKSAHSEAGNPSDAPIYVLCMMGGRATQAANQLNTAGANAIVVAGGTQAWAEAGYELQAG